MGKVDPSGTTSISDIHQRVQSRVYEAQRAAPVDLGPSAGQPRDGPDRDGQIGPGGGRVPGPQKLEAAHPANRVDPQRMRTEADARNVPLPIREMQEVIGPAVDPIGAGALGAGTFGVATAAGASPEQAARLATAADFAMAIGGMAAVGPTGGPDVAAGLRRPTGEPAIEGAMARQLRGPSHQPSSPSAVRDARSQLLGTLRGRAVQLTESGGLVGQNPQNQRTAGSGRMAGATKVDTDLPGGQDAARGLFEVLTGRPASGARDVSLLPGGVEVQYRATSKTGVGKIDITNPTARTTEKITFRRGR